MCVFSCTPWAPSSCMTKIRMHTMHRKSRSVGSTLSPRLNERRRLGTPGGRWGLRTCAPASEGGSLRNHSLWSGGCPALCTDSCARIWHSALLRVWVGTMGSVGRPGKISTVPRTHPSSRVRSDTCIGEVDPFARSELVSRLLWLKPLVGRHFASTLRYHGRRFPRSLVTQFGPQGLNPRRVWDAESASD